MRSAMALAFVSVIGLAAAAEPLKSGLPVGGYVVPFEPFNVTGEFAGQDKCLVCLHGGDPVACVFAREVTPALTALIKKLDEATAKNTKASMGSFVCVCSGDREATEKTLAALAKKEGVKRTTLAVCPEAGPDGYKLSKQAGVTVLLYVEGQVKTNFAFEKLTEKDVEAVLAGVPKILPKE